MRIVPALLLAAVPLTACHKDPPPPPGRQEREAGVRALAGGDGPVSASYVAQLMGDTNFDLRRCDATVAAGAPGSAANPQQVAQHRAPCTEQALRVEDQHIRARVQEDQRTGQINAATARAALALQDRRLRGAITALTQAQQTSSDGMAAVSGGGAGSSGGTTSGAGGQSGQSSSTGATGAASTGATGGGAGGGGSGGG